MKETFFDVIIVGGGLVGLTAANLAAIEGLSVMVIEPNPPTREQGDKDFDLRCSAITPASRTIFQKLKVWDAMVQARVSPYCHMEIWDKLGFGELQFDASAGETLGHIIENRVMIKALWEKANELNIQLMTHAHPISIERKSDCIEITFEQTSEVITNSAKVLIGADGGQSWCRTIAQIPVSSKEYHQSALVATVQTEYSHQETARQRFLPEGPLAFLPLSDPHRCSIVWTAKPESIEKLKVCSMEAFCETLSHQFDYRLGRVFSVSERQSFPLKMQKAKQTVQERMALIGDAAHVIHPLAGQGVNLGLLDAACLINVLKEAKERNCDLGHSLILRKYERVRKGHTLQLISEMEFLNRIFGTSLSPIIGLRSFGLNLINKSPFLKNRILTSASGLRYVL